MNIGGSGNQVLVLARVAAHLASALDILSLNGCDWFTTDLAEMPAGIDGHRAPREQCGPGGPRAARPASPPRLAPPSVEDEPPAHVGGRARDFPRAGGGEEAGQARHILRIVRASEGNGRVAA